MYVLLQDVAEDQRDTTRAATDMILKAAQIQKLTRSCGRMGAATRVRLRRCRRVSMWICSLPFSSHCRCSAQREPWGNPGLQYNNVSGGVKSKLT
jgi:hypothetical protein